jgi:phage tail sheath protein FI
MVNYSTPGLYYERVDSGAPAIAPLRTDIAAFVGIAQSGPVSAALPVDSWRQFQAWYGGCIGSAFLAYAVYAFFQNGGSRAWIVRVASDLAQASAATTALASGAPGWRIEATSPGAWGDALSATVLETHDAQTLLDPARSTPEYARVSRVTGFQRGTHVRIPVAPGKVQYRIVSAVDAAQGRLYWVNPDPRYRLPTDAPLVGLDPNAQLLIETIDYTVIATAQGKVVASARGLSLSTIHPRYGPTVLAPLPSPPANSAGWQLPMAPPMIAIVDVRTAADVASLAPLAPAARSQPLCGGVDGLATLTPQDFVGEPMCPLDSDSVRAAKLRGISALADVSEIALVAVPDILIRPELPPTTFTAPPCVPDPCLPGPAAVAPALSGAPAGELPPVFSDAQIHFVQAALVALCESRRDCFALLDCPWDCVSDPRLGIAGARAWRQRFDTSFAALYFAWIEVVDPLFAPSIQLRAIPACGHVAGFCARTDLAIGVYKAPANGPLNWLQNFTFDIDAVTHGILNTEGINALRAFRGRGLRIFGARTLSSDPDWMFVNVRRLMMMMEKAIRLSTQWCVFEPNNFATRSKVLLSLTNFLLALWQKGALAGNVPRAAFYVKCDGGNNTAATQADGELIAEVGVAPAMPFEFIVVRVGRVDNSLQVTDTTQGTGVGS